MAAAYFVYSGDSELKVRLRRISLFIIPVVGVFFVWLGIASVKYGQLALRDPAYVESNLRQSSSTKFEGYDLDAISNDFWTRETYTGLFTNLGDYLGLAVKKFDRLWGAPFNDLHRSFIFSSGTHDRWHQFLVLTGLIGMMVLALRGAPMAGWLVFIAGYYTLIHVILHSVARYNFNAMPLVLIGSSFALVEIGRSILGRRELLMKVIIPAVALSFVAAAIDYQWINTIFGIALSRASVAGELVVKSVLIIAAVHLIGRLLLEGQNTLRCLLLPIVAGVLIMSVTWTTALTRDNWAEWECRLDDPAKKAGTRFYISDTQAIAGEAPLLLAIDITASKGRTGTYTVSVGNLAQQFVVGSKPETRDFYFKPSYSYAPAQAGLGMEQLRQYAMINLTSSMVQPFLQKDGFVDISVAVDSLTAPGTDFITLYGRYLPDAYEAYIPSVRYTSLERWSVEGDPRIRVLTKFASDSAKSYYIERNASPEPGVQDLSPSPGKQTGRYDIFLVQWRNDSTVAIY